jgi:hypothetical protein
LSEKKASPICWRSTPTRRLSTDCAGPESIGRPLCHESFLAGIEQRTKRIPSARHARAEAAPYPELGAGRAEARFEFVGDTDGEVHD